MTSISSVKDSPANVIKISAAILASSILGRKSTPRLKANQTARSPPLSENLKFGKRMGFSVLGSLITVKYIYEIIHICTAVIDESEK